jgi:hypothetical protein
MSDLVFSLFKIVFHFFAFTLISAITLQGLPIAMELSGILPRTTDPAPIITFFPIFVLGRIIHFFPIKTFSHIIILFTKATSPFGFSPILISAVVSE